jgi:serine/threonine protein kinase
VLLSFHAQLGRILERLHSAGVVHGDIHPTNVFMVLRRPWQLANTAAADPTSTWSFDAFGSDERVFLIAWVVVDCTLATLTADSGQQIPHAHGPYTAAEQLRGDAIPATDMYALGATMYFAMTGREIPTAQNRQMSGRADVVMPDARFPTSDIADEVHRLLALAPADRPPAGATIDWSTIGSEYCGTLEVADDAFVITDSFEPATELADREQALEIHQRLKAQSTRQGEHRYWIERLSHAP